MNAYYSNKITTLSIRHITDNHPISELCRHQKTFTNAAYNNYETHRFLFLPDCSDNGRDTGRGCTEEVSSITSSSFPSG